MVARRERCRIVSVEAKRVDKWSELEEGPIGTFLINPDRKKLFVKLPNCQGVHSINLDATKQPPCWTLTGTDAAPTLSPSLVVAGRWHGWLRDGVFTDA